MDIELIIALAAGAALGVGYMLWTAKREREFRNRVLEQVAHIAQERATPPPPPPLTRKIVIAGTSAYTGDLKFLTSWGISPSTVKDAVVVAGPTEALTEEVQDCLSMCFCQSKTRGKAATTVLKTNSLKEGESLFFVVTEDHAGRPDMTAFVTEKG